jgi:hypothetical protein
LQPPPTLTIAGNSLAALLAPGGALADVAAAGRGVDVQIVQWGASPMNESAGLAAVS